MDGDVISYLRFNASGVNDLSGKEWENKGVIFDKPGRFGGKAGYFTSARYLKLKNGIISLNNDFTVGFWNKRNSYGVFTIVLGLERYGNSSDAFQIDDGNRNFLTYRGENTISYSQAPTYVDDKWHYYTFCRKEKTLYFFTDGVLLTTIFTGNTICMLDCVGYWGYNGDSGHVGCLDELLIMKKALWTADFTPPASYLFGSNMLYQVGNAIYGMKVME